MRIGLTSVYIKLLFILFDQPLNIGNYLIIHDDTIQYCLTVSFPLQLRELQNMDMERIKYRCCEETERCL